VGCAAKHLLKNYRLAGQRLTGRGWFFDHFIAGMRISSGAFAAAGSLASTLARSISAWRISIA